LSFINAYGLQLLTELKMKKERRDLSLLHIASFFPNHHCGQENENKESAMKRIDLQKVKLT